MNKAVLSWKFLFPVAMVIAIPLIILSVLSIAPFGNSNGGLSGYEELLSEVRISEITKILLRAAIVSLFATFFSFLISYILIIYTSSTFRLVFFTLLTLPFLINESVRVFSWQTVLAEDGWFNFFLAAIFGHEMVLFDGSNNGNVYLVMIISCIPFGVFICSAALTIIKDRYWMIAEDLKMNELSKLFKVLVPLSRAAIFASFFVILFISLAMSSEANFLAGDTKISTRNLVLSLMSASKFQAIFALGTIILFFLSAAGASLRLLNIKQQS